jgi:hypothetical protein
MPVYFFIAVEDDLSDAVLRRLLDHVRRGFGVRARYPLPALPHLKPSPTGYGAIKANARAFNLAAASTPHILLTDLDVANCAPDLIHAWLGGPPHPNLLLRVAVREVEAWLLADGNNFAHFLSVPSRLLPANAEAVPDPKLEIVTLARQSIDPIIQNDLVPRPGSTAVTGRYFNRCLSNYVRTLWDVDEAAKRSDSLNRALAALKRFKPVVAPSA